MRLCSGSGYRWRGICRHGTRWYRKLGLRYRLAAHRAMPAEVAAAAQAWMHGQMESTGCTALFLDGGINRV
ncbi:MAG: hypothetical protein H3C62_00700 [Gemmatimonadaceae bacterium]|nr:hypothetical protein [Gemmatimonadaceae bacterium]